MAEALYPETNWYFCGEVGRLIHTVSVREWKLKEYRAIDYHLNFFFFSKSSGKKFRSRNDIRAFMEQQGQFDFEPEKFDFCIHRKKNKNNVAKMRQELPAEMPKKIKTLLPKTKTPVGTPETTPVSDVLPPVLTPAVTPVTPVDVGGKILFSILFLC